MTDAKKVWMPDTFFRNEKEGRFHNILVPNVYIRIFPNGNVLYSIRYAVQNTNECTIVHNVHCLFYLYACQCLMMFHFSLAGCR